jgi:hypothetical protein
VHLLIREFHVIFSALIRLLGIFVLLFVVCETKSRLMMAGYGRKSCKKEKYMKNKYAFETKVYVCISDELMKQDAGIRYHKCICFEICKLMIVFSHRHLYLL